MSSWEYCTVGSGAVDPTSAYFYTTHGIIDADLGKTSTGRRQNKYQASARLISLLGRTGWELVSSDGGDMTFKRESSEHASYSYLDELCLTEQQRRAIRGEDSAPEHDARQSLSGAADTSPGSRQASAGSGCLGILLLMGMTLRHLGAAADVLFKRRGQ